MKIYRGTPGNDSHSGQERKMLGGAGNDFLDRDPRWNGDHYIYPKKKAILFGEAGHDRLDGLFIEDRLYGGEGNDQLTGGRLYGGDGDDWLVARSGFSDKDRFTDDGAVIHSDDIDWFDTRLVGGKGDDTFVLTPFYAEPTLPDFNHRHDTILIRIYENDYEGKYKTHYDREKGELYIDYRYGSENLSQIIAHFDPGTKVTARDLDIIFIA